MIYANHFQNCSTAQSTRSMHVPLAPCISDVVAWEQLLVLKILGCQKIVRKILLSENLRTKMENLGAEKQSFWGIFWAGGKIKILTPIHSSLKNLQCLSVGKLQLPSFRFTF